VINIKALHYLIALAECLNFSRAADRCAVTQPTLSIQVRKLEEYLGVTLFDRNRARVVLTDEGANVLRLARIVVAAADEILLFRRTRCATTRPLLDIDAVADRRHNRSY
jgi:DNA-binding transcriptional LysR family regulator